MQPLPDVSDLDWLMTKVRDGVVGLGVGWRYHVTLKPVNPKAREKVLDCDDAVYQLEDLGLVLLEPDGPVSPTRAGRRQWEAHLKARAAERAAARRDRRAAERHTQVAA